MAAFRQPASGAMLAGLLLFLLGAASLGADIHTQHRQGQVQARIAALRGEGADAQRLMLLVAESQTAIRHWLLSGTAEDGDATLRADKALREEGAALWARLAPVLEARGIAPSAEALDQLVQTQARAREAAAQEGAEAARAALLAGGANSTVMRLRGVLAELRQAVERDLPLRQAALRRLEAIDYILSGATGLLMVAMLLGGLALLARRRGTAEAARGATERQGREVASLLRIGELLRSSRSAEDVRDVVVHAAREMLPGLAGGLYLFDAAQDRFVLLGAWGEAGDDTGPDALPAQLGANCCWALKRGRTHRARATGLRCDHGGAAQALCVPLQARGELHGLLHFPHGDTGDAAVPRLAQALADAACLALSNVALRARLGQRVAPGSRVASPVPV